MISLITAYKNRGNHLQVMLSWLQRIREDEGFTDFEWIVVEGDRSSTSHTLLEGKTWIHSFFCNMERNFHKSRLLNIGSREAQGSFLLPLDIDLLPAHGVLELHARLASGNPRVLFTGYRLLLNEIPGFPLSTANELCADLLARYRYDGTAPLGPEENVSALCKYLLAGERFGVCPFFPRELFFQLGGYDENYVGWGAEDQDLFERICAQGITPVRSYDLLYLHMPHPDEPGWKENSLTTKNREWFYEKRRRFGNRS